MRLLVQSRTTVNHGSRFEVARLLGCHYRMSMWPRIARILRHPIMMMVVLILLCRVVKNAYPFNSFPMYADPSPHPSDYLIVADGAGIPINVKSITGRTSAQVKKIFTESLNKACHKLNIEAANAPPEVRQKVLTEAMAQLREEASKRKGKGNLPDKVRITNVLIYQDYKKSGVVFREEPQLLGAE